MILNAGSLNQDLVYAVPHFVRAGETLTASRVERHAGGKGLNQSLALARSGCPVRHLGAVGKDGRELIETLRESGVAVEDIAIIQEPTGHAVIQKDAAGQNSIVLFGGANQALTETQVRQAISTMSPGAWLLTQNETNLVPEILRWGRQAGLKVAWNPAPMKPECRDYPLDCVDCLIVNEIEGAELSGEAAPREIFSALRGLLPRATIVLTLGAAGAMAGRGTEEIVRPASPVEKVVDTTAAGDTFIGYFLSATARGESLSTALEQGSRAAARCVQRSGAAPSIPWKHEI